MRQDRGPETATAGAVLLLDSARGWPADFVDHVSRLGFMVVRVDDGKLLPFFVLAGGVDAILVDVASLGVTEALALRKCREHAPRTSVVVVAPDNTQAGVTRALEGGATAFLVLPASPRRIGAALRSGEPVVETTS
jgi:DNA-binding NarL/FixJ family response regulator